MVNHWVMILSINHQEHERVVEFGKYLVFLAEKKEGKKRRKFMGSFAHRAFKALKMTGIGGANFQAIDYLDRMASKPSLREPGDHATAASSSIHRPTRYLDGNRQLSNRTTMTLPSSSTGKPI